LQDGLCDFRKYFLLSETDRLFLDLEKYDNVIGGLLVCKVYSLTFLTLPDTIGWAYSPVYV